MEQEGEHFALLNQAAYPPRRYDFISDIQRLERMVHSFEPTNSGLAILLTNDPSYWKPPRQGWENAVDPTFRIHEGRVLKGEMAWSRKASEGTKKRKGKTVKAQGFLPRQLAGLLNSQRREVRKVPVSRCEGAAFESVAYRCGFGLPFVSKGNMYWGWFGFTNRLYSRQKN